MRDDTRNWEPIAAETAAITASGIGIQRIMPARQTIVSGPSALTHFDDRLGSAFGWPDIAGGPSYAIALRRDRVLLINGPPLQDGWQGADGLAVSEMTGGYAVFEMAGPSLPDVLKRAGDIFFDHPSRSAVRLFGEFSVILYQFNEANRVRLHVSVAFAPALEKLLRSYLDHLR